MATILVVDDRNINREFLATLFGYAGYHVLEACNGAEALDRVRAEQPDLIITDIVMPTMGGIEFVKRLRADSTIGPIPVIFYTATFRLDEASLFAQSCGAAAVIAKPARPQLILDTAASALADATPADATPASAGSRQTALPTPSLPPRIPPGNLSRALDGLSLRLAALLELGLELAAERDPARLLDVASRAAQAICAARLASIGMPGEAGTRPDRHAVQGADDAERPLFAGLDLGAVVSDGQPHRFNDPTAAAATLPAWHRPVGNLLIVPIKTATRTFGWLSLADREGGTAPFGEDDEQIAVTLATQLAQAYENLHLYSETMAYAGRLEAEIAGRKRAQLALRESEGHFRAVFDHAPIGMAVVSLSGKILRVNRVLCDLAGYAMDDLQQRCLHEIIDAGDAPRAMADLHALASGELPQDDLERHYRRRDGSLGWMLLTASELLNEGGEALHFIVQFKDISERKRAEEELRLAASVFDATMDGIMVTDAAAQIISVNPAFTAITGFSADEAIGQKPCLMRSEQDAPDYCNEVWSVLSRDGRWEGEIWNRRKNGEAFLEWLTISMVPGADGKPLRYVGVFNDITELRRKDEHIRHLAFHDPLTGLANRSLLLDRLEHSIVSAGRENLHLGLMYIDLNRFKAVNDLLGHDIGDGLLQEIARRLSQCVRQSDTVARMGGDEFVVLLEFTRDVGDYAVLARKLIAALSQPAELGGHTIPVGASIGIACYPGDGCDVLELMRNADAAMYAAKSTGRSTYRFFRPEMSEGTTQRLELEMELRNAVRNGELELHYQPVVSLGSDATVGVEALVRWQHPQRGLVLPADFIPLAEETGIIAELGDWVLAEACRQCSAWQARGLGHIRIAVTVAARQLRQGDLAARIASLARRHGISPANIEIKLTESVLLAASDVIENLIGRLHEIGVSVAVDAFGTGASSLACLRRLPIDMLSIDRSLVSMADHDEDDAQFVRSILALGEALKATVVAEGVETESQADFLRACGCTVGQGYYYARPAPAAHIEAWLRAHAGRGMIAHARAPRTH